MKLPLFTGRPRDALAGLIIQPILARPVAQQRYLAAGCLSRFCERDARVLIFAVILDFGGRGSNDTACEIPAAHQCRSVGVCHFFRWPFTTPARIKPDKELMRDALSLNGVALIMGSD